VDAERINLPAIPNYYGRYRLHLDLECCNAQKNLIPGCRNCCARADARFNRIQKQQSPGKFRGFWF
jgi:hypothetical protein